jgi:hypothetical protein
MSTVRGYHTATLLPSGLVLVAGGDNNAFSFSIQSSAELYNPANNTWSPAGPMAIGRASHTATLLVNGKVLVAGGGTSHGNSVGLVSSAEIYDPITNSWASAGSMGSPREGHTATLLGDGQVLVVGGGVPDSAELYVADGFTFSMLGGNTVAAGRSFLFTVQAIDPFGKPLTTLTGPTRVTLTATPADPQDNFPITGTLDSSGFGFFFGNFKTAGSYKLIATDGTLSDVSSAIAVTAADTSHFTVAAPATATTGSALDVTVKAFDYFGNLATAYSGQVHFTSSDSNASLPPDALLSAGVGVFHVTLNSAGSQTITATDTISTNPTITGTSSPTATRGLTVTALTPTATGFNVSFSKPIVASGIYLYGGTVAKPIQNVTLVGNITGPLLGPVNGVFVIDPSGTSATFKASSDWLENIAGQANGLLPNDTWTVTLQSGTGSGSNANGFFDVLGAPLDGSANAGHADFVTTFVTRNDGTPALTIPDFARGPDGASTIKTPNSSATGIPVTLANAPAGTKDVAFTLTYDPTLLTPTGAGIGDASGTGSIFSMGSITSVDATHARATFTWHDGTGLAGNVVLGDVFANVPNSAANRYRAKELLILDTITLNGAPFSGVTSPAVHVNAYFGDLSGDGQLTGLDLAFAGNVAAGSPASPIGLSAYKLVDPALIGDIGGDGSIDAAAISSLAGLLAHVATPVIPTPPSGLTITPGGPDPALSLGASQTAGGIVNVQVTLDDARPDGSTGMTEAIIGLTYNPKALAVSAADITLGSLPASSSGWRLVAVIDATTGQIAIDLYSTTAITQAQAGTLINITFHVVPGAYVPATAVQLVNSVSPQGHWYSTEIVDAENKFVLSPGVDRIIIQTDAIVSLGMKVRMAGAARGVRSGDR